MKPTRSKPLAALLALCTLVLTACPNDDDTPPADVADADTSELAADTADAADAAPEADIDAPDVSPSDAAADPAVDAVDDVTTDAGPADTVLDADEDAAVADTKPDVTEDAPSPDTDPEVDATPEDIGTSDAGPEDIAGDDTSEDADTCRSAIDRGVWFYRHPGNPLGSDAIVGSTSEAATIANLQSVLTTVIYGNYGDRPSDDTAAIASWNEQLHTAGIESQLLIGDAADIFIGCREAMLEEVQTRLIDFNAAVSVEQQFDGLHLDIEPQQYDLGTAFPTTTSCGLRLPDWPFWDDLAPTGRARRYEMLLATLVDVRTYLDDNGHAATPLYADLAPWIDSSASFDWSESTGIADGSDWLMQAAAQLDGITFMTYERGTESLIDSSISGEAALPTEVRVSVSAKERAPLSATTTWADLSAMFDIVEAIEATHCGARPVDLFNYRYLNE